MYCKKGKKYAIAGLLSISLCVSAVGSGSGALFGTPVFATSLTNDLIESSEKEKDEAEASKNALKSGLTNVQSLIESLEKEKNDLQGYITELDADLAVINDKVDDLTVQIGNKEQEIEVKTEELAEAEETERHQYELMKKRVKFMYERGGKSSIEMLLDSDSFTEFLNKAEFIGKITAYDRRLLDKYIASKEAVADKKAELEKENEELIEAKSNLQNEQEAMETLIAHKEEEISNYEADIGNKEAAVREYEAEIAAQDQIIKDLEATILAEKKRLLEQKARSSEKI